MPYNSTIKNKTGYCLDCPDSRGTQILIAGRCQSHYKTHRFKVNDEKHKAREEKQARDVDMGNGIIYRLSTELEQWFLDRRNELTGICKHCGGKTTKDDDKYFKHSIAHILPKAYFLSVATHPKNFIELCFWNKSCHTNLDNKILDITDLNCYNEVIEKFVALYPSIDKKEIRRIPETLLQYIETDL
jgi:hypothetical protein